MKASKKLKNKIIIWNLIFLIVLLLVLAIDIIENTDTDFNQGIFFQTRIQGTGVDANVTLNYTVIGNSGCSECGNMSSGQLNYLMSGNFTSEINDTGSTTSNFDTIKWTVNLVNTSDVIGFSFVQIIVGNAKIGVFYRDGRVTNTTSANNLLQTNINFTFQNDSWILPEGINYDDVLGFSGIDIDSTNANYAFLRNGTVLQSNEDYVFTSSYGIYTIPQGFNTSDIIGFALESIDGPSTGDTAVFFRNKTYLKADAESPKFTFDQYFSFTIPSDFNIDDAIGIVYDNTETTGQISMFFINKSHITDTNVPDFVSTIGFTIVNTDKYNDNANISERTNISIFTRISNDSITFTPYTEYSVTNDGSYAELNATINTSQNVGRYIQYKAEFKTTDKYFTPQLLNVSINYTAGSVPDTTSPIVNTTFNITSPKINDIINFTGNATDETGLSTANITYNMSGILTKVNFTLSGTSAQVNNVTKITTGRGSVINFTMYATDTSNNVKQNSTLITIVDSIANVTINLNNTAPKINEVVNVSSNVFDPDNLSFCLIKNNQTGVFVNTTYKLSGTSDKCSNAATITVAHAIINFTVEINDSIGGIIYQNSTKISVVNSLPILTSASINDTSPTNIEDLQCDNGSVSDADSDVITLLYNWTKGGIDQVINTKTLSNTLTSINDIWICRITPFDGFENGTTVSSSSVSIGTGFVAPTINFTNSTPLTAELLKGEWLNLSVNFTDTSENGIDNHTAYFCKTDSVTTNGCLGVTYCKSNINISAGNYSSCRLNITNITDFPLGAITFYTFVVDNTSLISASKSNTFTIQDITPPILNNWSLQYTNLNDASGNTNQFNVSVTDNVSNVQTITFDLNVTLNATKSFTFTKSLSVAPVTYPLFQSSETLLRGFYNITKVTVTDNSSNSQTYNFTNISFTVSAQPSGGGISGGGGGGGATLAPEKVVEIEVEVAVERCGNLFCEECDKNSPEGCEDENPLSCPIDCRYFSLDDAFCTPIFNCGNWNLAWFTNSMIILVVSGMVLTQYLAKKKGVKRL